MVSFINVIIRPVELTIATDSMTNYRDIVGKYFIVL